MIRILVSFFFAHSIWAAEPDTSAVQIDDKEFLYFLAYSLTQNEQVIDPLHLTEHSEEQYEPDTNNTEETKDE